METINSMASAAAKAVWGEGNNNTTSTTNTTTNEENQKPGTETTNMNNETQGQEPVSGKLGDTSKGEPFDAGNIESGETAQSKGPTMEHPSTTGDTGGFKAAQADVRDPESNPTTDPKTEAERKNVDDTGNLDKSDNPGKVDGPGPKPIDEVARERGGDAGRTGEAGGADATKEGAEGVEDKNKNKGSGEEYVKSSGLAADGGDFDATKPGAGREADRLLEEKGIANPAAEAASGKKDDESPASPDSGKEKKSLKDKIKAKLHKN